MSAWAGAFGIMLMAVAMVEVYRRTNDPQLGGWSINEQMQVYATWVLGLILFGSGVAGAFG